MRSILLAFAIAVAPFSLAAAGGCVDDGDPTTVIVPLDAPDLQAGVDLVLDGGTVLLCDGTYSTPGFYDVVVDNRTLTIGSLSGDPSLCVLDGLDTNRILEITSSDVTLEGLHLTRGTTSELTGGGAIYTELSSLRAENSWFTKNFVLSGDRSGGAIWMGDMLNVEFTDCQFDENRTYPALLASPNVGGPGLGGAIFGDATTIDIVGCDFTANFSWYGHAIYGTADQIEIRDSIFRDHRQGAGAAASSVGGIESGAVLVEGSVVTIDDCRFIDNESFDGPGALEFRGNGTYTVMNSTFTGNFTTEDDGGAIGTRFVGSDATLEVTDTDFVGNWSYGSGGAIYWPNVLTLEGCFFLGNRAAFTPGGAVYADSLTAVGCRFDRNGVSDDYGAVIWATQYAFVDSCEFYDNTDLTLQAATVDLSNSLFARNSTVCQQGTVTCVDGVVQNTTFAYNWSCPGAADASSVLATNSLTIENSILAFGMGKLIECPPDLTFRCNNVYGNELGDFTDCLAGLEGVDGNFSAPPLFCSPEFTLASISPCLPGNHPDGVDCGLIGAFGGGGCGASSVDDLEDDAGVGSGSVVGLGFEEIGPNPVSGVATLRFALPEALVGERVLLRVFDVEGGLVRTLLDEPGRAGSRTIVWDGLDDAGRVPSNGTYFARLESGPWADSRKLLLLR